MSKDQADGPKVLFELDIFLLWWVADKNERNIRSTVLP
jgi:hypothetical protein